MTTSAGLSQVELEGLVTDVDSAVKKDVWPWSPGTPRGRKALGARRVPAVAVDGVLLDSCQGGVDEAALMAAGIGTPLA